MNLLLFEPAELAGGSQAEVELAAGDPRARHLREVLRVQAGQVVRAGAIRGPTGRAEVVAVAEGRIRLAVTLDGSTCQRPTVDLVVAVPRPKVVARVLETAASFGVGRIDLVNAWRVDRSYLDSPRLGAAQLTAALRAGCEQGATTWMPDVALHRLLMPFLEGAAERWSSAAHLIIAHPRAGAAIETAFRPGTRAPAVIAVGPERGWIDREVHSFAALGFTAVRIGAPVLRVDAAVAALLAQLELLGRLEASATW